MFTCEFLVTKVNPQPVVSGWGNELSFLYYMKKLVVEYSKGVNPYLVVSPSKGWFAIARICEYFGIRLTTDTKILYIHSPLRRIVVDRSYIKGWSIVIANYETR